MNPLSLVLRVCNVKKFGDWDAKLIAAYGWRGKPTVAARRDHPEPEVPSSLGAGPVSLGAGPVSLGAGPVSLGAGPASLGAGKKSPESLEPRGPGGLFLKNKKGRRGRESNPRTEILQISALPLGYPVISTL